MSGSGDRIASLASSFLSVRESTPVHELLSSLKEPHEHAIAVLDCDSRVLGIILPQALVELLGKPFGRDLLMRERVENIMVPVVCFPKDEYIQEVRERLGGSLELETTSHWVLVERDGRFFGHISSRDILIHAMKRHQYDMETAARIQGRFVPPSFAAGDKSVAILASSVMAQGVGGDYYFVREYAPGRWFFCLCDISGKGIAAALVTAVLSGFLETAPLDTGLSSLIQKLNALILGAFTLEKYLTGVFARFDARSGRLEYCDMGHALFYTVEDGQLRRVSEVADNVPTGLVESLSPQIRSIPVLPGSLFVILSDGLCEQSDREGAIFDLSTVGRCLADAMAPAAARGQGSCDRLLRAKIRLLEAFWTFKRDMPQHDDVSMLFFSFAAYKGLSSAGSPVSSATVPEGCAG